MKTVFQFHLWLIICENKQAGCTTFCPYQCYKSAADHKPKRPLICWSWSWYNPWWRKTQKNSWSHEIFSIWSQHFQKTVGKISVPWNLNFGLALNSAQAQHSSNTSKRCGYASKFFTHTHLSCVYVCVYDLEVIDGDFFSLEEWLFVPSLISFRKHHWTLWNASPPTSHHVYYYRFQRYQRKCKTCLESQNAEHIAVPLPQLSICLLLSLIFRKK